MARFLTCFMLLFTPLIGFANDLNTDDVAELNKQLESLLKEIDLPLRNCLESRDKESCDKYRELYSKKNQLIEKIDSLDSFEYKA